MNTRHLKVSKTERNTLSNLSSKKNSRKSTPSSARDKKENQKVQPSLQEKQSKSEECLHEIR